MIKHGGGQQIKNNATINEPERTTQNKTDEVKISKTGAHYTNQSTKISLLDVSVTEPKSKVYLGK